MNERTKKRDAIISSARKIFSSKGLNAATMDEIARASGLSVGTLYRLFASKEDLYAILTIDTLKFLAERMSGTASAGIPVEEKIERFCGIVLEAYQNEPRMLINLFHLRSAVTLNNLTEEVFQVLRQNAAAVYSAVTDVMKQGVANKIFIDEHPGVLADILWALFAGIILCGDSKQRLTANENSVEMTLNTGLNLIRRGIKTKKVEQLYPQPDRFYKINRAF